MDRTEREAVLTVVAIIAQNEKLLALGEPLLGTPSPGILTFNKVRFLHRYIVYVDLAAIQPDVFVGQADDSLDVNPLGSRRVPENHNVSTAQSTGRSGKGTGQDILPIAQSGQHTVAHYSVAGEGE